MSQTIFTDINPAATSGTQLASYLNDFKKAILSGFSGTARPAELTAGGYWIDTTNSGSPNFYYSYKFYTGSTDIEVFRINLSSGKASIAGADSTFELTKISADAVGPIMKFIKNRIATNGEVLIGDIVGQLQFIGRAGDNSSNPVVVNIKVVSSDNQVSTASGSYLVFETTPAGATGVVEHMRLMDGYLGIGTTTPDATVHAKGTTGIKSERSTDDTTGAVFRLKKSRVAGTGAVQSGDSIGFIPMDAKDSTSAFSVVGSLELLATENHTGTNKGTKLQIKTTIIGTAVRATQIEIGDYVETLTRHKFSAQQYDLLAVATTATINQLAATKRIVEFTGTTVTSVRGINSGQAAQVITIHNRSTANVTIEHENASAAAADRIKLPSSASIVVLPQSSIELFYCVADSRWKVKSASSSSSGGGGISVLFDELANSPQKTNENGRGVYLYEATQAQELYMDFKVPASYVAGRAITLKIKHYSPDSSGSNLISGQSTLVRAADTNSSTTNQRTSTNTAITLGAGTVNKDQSVDLDITDSTGNINSVAISAGDSITVRVFRGTDTGTSDLRLLTKQCEVVVS